MDQPKTKQIAILHFIYDRQLLTGYSPTVREIATGVNLSAPSTVHGHIQRLIKKGFLIKDPAKPRALEITPAGLATLGVPVSEEPPLFTDDETLTTVTETTTTPILQNYSTLPANFGQTTNDLFTFQLHGNDMTAIGMLDGDWLLVKPQTFANSGDIVVAQVDNLTYVRRFISEGTLYRLQPENTQLTAIVTDHIDIQGVVVSLYRPIIN